MSQRLAVLVITATLVAGCRGGGHHGRVRTVSYGASWFVSSYERAPGTGREVAVMHILFVPDVEAPAGGFGKMGGVAGGAKRDSTIGFTYWESGGRRLDMQPIKVTDGRFLEAGGRRFDIERGNVFCAEVSLHGAVRLTQVPARFEQPDTPPEPIVAAIQAMVHSPRVRGLKQRT